MDAPLAELLIRLLLALVVTGVFTIFALSWPYIGSMPVSTLYRFMTVVLGMNAAWRWYVLWIGLQHDETGQWAREAEPYIRTIGNALLILLYISIGLVAYFHVRHVRKDKRPVE